MLVEPVGQPDIPGNRRLGQTADFLHQSGRQGFPPTAHQTAFRALPQDAAAVGFGTHESPALVIADQVGSARPPPSGQLAGAAQVPRQPVVNLFGGATGQFWIVQQASSGRFPNPHLHQPAVDDEVAGDVPQEGVAAAPAGGVIQSGVQQLVGENEQAFCFVQACGRVDPEGPVVHVDGGYPDVVQLAEPAILAQGEVHRHRAQQGMVAGQPAASLFGGGGRPGGTGGRDDPFPGALDGLAHPAGDAIGQQRLPVGRLAVARRRRVGGVVVWFWLEPGEAVATRST